MILNFTQTRSYSTIITYSTVQNSTPQFKIWVFHIFEMLDLKSGESWRHNLPSTHSLRCVIVNLRLTILTVIIVNFWLMSRRSLLQRDALLFMHYESSQWLNDQLHPVVINVKKQPFLCIVMSYTEKAIKEYSLNNCWSSQFKVKASLLVNMISAISPKLLLGWPYIHFSCPTWDF